MRLRIAIFCFLTAWLPMAQAEEKPAYYIGVHDIAFPPFSWLEQNQLRGLDRDVLDAFAQNEGIELIYVPMPRVRALTLLRKGWIDALYPDDIGWTTDLKTDLGLQLAYSAPAIRNESGLFMLKRKECRSDFSAIGTLLGWVVGGYQEQEKQGLVRVQRFTSIDQVLEAGLNGSVDAVYAGRMFLEYHIKKYPNYSVFEFCADLPLMQGNSRLSAMRHPKLITQFNDFLQQHSEQILAMRAHYLTP